MEYIKDLTLSTQDYRVDIGGWNKRNPLPSLNIFTSMIFIRFLTEFKFPDHLKKKSKKKLINVGLRLFWTLEYMHLVSLSRCTLRKNHIPQLLSHGVLFYVTCHCFWTFYKSVCPACYAQLCSRFELECKFEIEKSIFCVVS